MRNTTMSFGDECGYIWGSRDDDWDCDRCEHADRRNHRSHRHQRWNYTFGA
jgi:hypothetical protein